MRIDRVFLRGSIGMGGKQRTRCIAWATVPWDPPLPMDYEYMTALMENGTAIYAGCTRHKLFTGTTIVTVRQKTADSSTQVTGPITMLAQPITIQLPSSDSSLFVTAATATSASSSSISSFSSSAQPSSTASQVSETGSGAPTSSPQSRSTVYPGGLDSGWAALPYLLRSGFGTSGDARRARMM
ncbi:uncharacterized protein BDCG_05577 [Blastomyces dermatitidis ER-3]|uniref:Uncharacterized protein n=1 Tax=Ajellomyces dermatitidis (strain ER-3 / ATCC MYA-2586) TaxID=559297 RepID=A0ABP2F3B9_AJEDR|nr:uncharacterized protein BDCG_05577 [Blastomyces dermatitidis ER-3]EEQ90457.1 hypothetical protein BDCG_05577 [Blastomyces dermatitidis ER-3]